MKSSFYVLHLLAILPVLLFTSLHSSAQTHSGQPWTKQQAEKWYNKGEWLNGLKLKPSESLNKQEFAKRYHQTKDWWDEAFSYLKTTDFAKLKPGKYPIDGENVFATVAEGPSKTFESSAWESHRNYQDIHYVIKGKEKIGAAPISSITVTHEYDPKRDVVFYKGDGKYYTADQATFFIFFPIDAHRPNIKVKGYDVVKKVVIKISTNKNNYHGN